MIGSIDIHCGEVHFDICFLYLHIISSNYHRSKTSKKKPFEIMERKSLKKTSKNLLLSVEQKEMSIIFLHTRFGVN